MEKRTAHQALIALLLVLLPNLVLTGVGLLMRGQARQVTESQAAAHFHLSRFLRQLGLSAFLLMPTGLWLARRRDRAALCSWGLRSIGRAVALGALVGVAVLVFRARPFAPERLMMDDTWWALITYAVVAAAEETLYRGLLQSRMEIWLGRWWGYVTTALLFTVLHLPARLLGGEPLSQSLVYAGVRLLPMALLFGATMLATGHVAAPTLVHLAWNWGSVLRRV